MFAAPQELPAQVFSRMPDSFRRDGQRSWMSHRGRVGSFLEGPAFDRNGNLYVVDIAFGRVFKVAPGGEFSLAVEYDGGPNGLAIHRDGHVYIADRNQGILKLDPESGRIENILAELPDGSALKGPNDLTFASNGDLFFTDQGPTGLQDPSGRLVRIGADGGVNVLLDNVPSPNGLVLDASERNVLLAVTRANAIWHVPLTRDRTGVGRVQMFIQLSGGPGGGPDGLALDQAGNLVICHAQLGTAWVFSAEGEPLYRIRSSEGPLITNAAFGGPDGRNLYMTESTSGTIMVARLPVPGWPLFSHQ